MKRARSFPWSALKAERSPSRSPSKSTCPTGFAPCEGAGDPQAAAARKRAKGPAADETSCGEDPEGDVGSCRDHPDPGRDPEREANAKRAGRAGGAVAQDGGCR
jgi:hypothetical protein